MASALRSTSGLRKMGEKRNAGTVIRRPSKSPTRSLSPQRAQAPTVFNPTQHAYADPTNSSRTILPNVFFERRDEEALSTQANQLFSARTIFSDDTSRLWLLNNVRSTKIHVKVDNVFYEINGNYVFKENQPCVLILHGFGGQANWANWIQLAYPLAQNGYSTIFVDLPGFGRSSGRSLDQTSWKRHAPEIFLGILCSFHLQTPTNVVAHCGGAATTVRTISRYPQWFRNRGLVFCNSVIGDFGESKIGEFESNLTKFNIHIMVFWIPDRDHTKLCIAYKRWNKLRQSGFRYLQLVDLDPVTQTMTGLHPSVRIPKIGRCSSENQSYVYKLSEEFIQLIRNALTQN